MVNALLPSHENIGVNAPGSSWQKPCPGVEVATHFKVGSGTVSDAGKTGCFIKERGVCGQMNVLRNSKH